MTGAGGGAGGAGGGGAGGAAGESRMPRKDGRLLVLPPSPVSTTPQLCFVEYNTIQMIWFEMFSLVQRTWQPNTRPVL